MQIGSLTAIASTTSGGASAESAKADVDYNSFLKLLIASMKNQDPTKPNDPAETLSQLASFSSVEQGIKLNEKLDSLLAVSSVGQAAGLIGKNVESLDGKIGGIAKSVEMSGSGLVVILASGKRLAISDGIRVS
jgi:flagellar basal-body rod modification protein FlgD